MDRITGYETDNLEFVSTGVCPGCQECMDIFGYTNKEKFYLDWSNGEVFDEGSFSWSPCDECNTSLGGNSYYAHGVDENGEINHFTVCHDCLMELNGYEIEE